MALLDFVRIELVEDMLLLVHLNADGSFLGLGACENAGSMRLIYDVDRTRQASRDRKDAFIQLSLQYTLILLETVYRMNLISASHALSSIWSSQVRLFNQHSSALALRSARVLPSWPICILGSLVSAQI